MNYEISNEAYYSVQKLCYFERSVCKLSATEYKLFSNKLTRTRKCIKVQNDKIKYLESSRTQWESKCNESMAQEMKREEIVENCHGQISWRGRI
jgi:hypothetical protein